jgi:hypothetical protein
MNSDIPVLRLRSEQGFDVVWITGNKEFVVENRRAESVDILSKLVHRFEDILWSSVFASSLDALLEPAHSKKAFARQSWRRQTSSTGCFCSMTPPILDG